MKLFYNKKSADPTYYAQQGIRNGSKTTTRNVKNFGKHSELLRITDDPLSYVKREIQKMNEGFYYFIHFEAEPEVPAEIEGRLRIMDDVLRYLCVRLDA